MMEKRVRHSANRLTGVKNINACSKILLKDMLVLFYYWCIKRIGKHKIGIGAVQYYLSRYDYEYRKSSWDFFKKYICLLFPITVNRKKNRKHFKINTRLVIFWGEHFGIDYSMHEELYTLFKNVKKGD